MPHRLILSEQSPIVEDGIHPTSFASARVVLTYNSDRQQLAVANEAAACELARLIAAPVPAGCLSVDRGEPCWASLMLQPDDWQPHPDSGVPIPRHIHAGASGIRLTPEQFPAARRLMVFRTWIMDADLIYPPNYCISGGRIYGLDFGSSLWGEVTDEIRQRLISLIHTVVFSYSRPPAWEGANVVLRTAASAIEEYEADWAALRSITYQQIRRALDVAHTLVPREERVLLANILHYRATLLPLAMRDQRAAFLSSFDDGSNANIMAPSCIQTAHPEAHHVG